MVNISPFFNNINISNVRFQANHAGIRVNSLTQPDSFSTNPLYSDFGSKAEIEKLAKSSPEVLRILKENKIPLNVNIKELEKLQQGHLKSTRIIAAKIYSSLPENLKSEVNLSDLQEAAMLHDYGKVLIPDRVLNKNDKLNPEERKIMELHSELGYELLKQKGVSPKVLNLVKYHHQTPQGNGYPEIKDYYEYGISSQILSTADKYSALCEARSYKEPMKPQEALEIIKEDAEKGLISKEVYKALEKSVLQSI